MDYCRFFEIFYIVYMQIAKTTVYIETTIPSLITARPSKDITKTYRQNITKFFWENESYKYDLFISKYVLEECGRGDVNAVKRRLELIKEIPFLDENEEVEKLAEEYFEYLNIPKKAKTDCFHLAICVIYKINYLLSWNMTHLGNPTFSKIVLYNGTHELWLPQLVTPDVFMEIQKEEVENGRL